MLKGCDSNKFDQYLLAWRQSDEIIMTSFIVWKQRTYSWKVLMFLYHHDLVRFDLTVVVVVVVVVVVIIIGGGGGGYDYSFE